MGRPLVSVVTPSYNHAHFIEDTIRSVLGQDYAHIEFIVMDGGSSDGTVDILKRYTGKLAWTSERDGGQSDAINRGIAQSRGDIVTWLCSDDTYLPGAVRRAVEVMDRNPHADIVYGDAIYTDALNQPMRMFRGWQFSLAEALATCQNPISQAASFIRRAAWERVEGLNASLQYVMDWELWLRMGRSGCTFLHVPEVWASARLHADSKSIGSGPKNAAGIVKVTEDFLANAEGEMRLSPVARRRALSSAHLTAAEELFHDAHTKEVRRHLWKAFQLSPWNLCSHVHIQLWLGCFLTPGSVTALRNAKARARRWCRDLS